MIYTKMTRKAMNLCYEAHKDQYDQSGQPYVFHPFHLAEQMQTEETVICALLHDVVEDTDYTFSDLESMGFPASVIEALRLLTHEKSVPYMDYVKAIAPNPIARQVKMADLRHNSDFSRMDPEDIDDWALKRNEKYHIALQYLEQF